MAGNFAATVAGWATEEKEVMRYVKAEAAQRVIALMQEPGGSVATTKKAVAVGAGLGKNGGRSKRKFGPISNPGGSGNLPVDTGFLRSSLVVGIGNVNEPLKAPPADGGSFSWDEAGANLIIQGAALTDPIVAVYTAAYAARMNYGFAGTDSLGRSYNQAGRRFVDLAAQQWPRIVAEVVAEARAK